MERKTCQAAVLGGHLEVLQWAWEHGCPWDASMCHLRRSGRAPVVLRWARGHSYDRDDGLAPNNAVYGTNEEVMRWLDELAG